jgi:hypothetical protein
VDEFVADGGNSGVDVTVIRWMLSLTPAERLAVLDDFVELASEVREQLGHK